VLFLAGTDDIVDANATRMLGNSDDSYVSMQQRLKDPHASSNRQASLHAQTQRQLVFEMRALDREKHRHLLLVMRICH
jgi:hypothetical protein